ncbi:MAG: methyltransferase domain-containing protein [Deltaproteobacteria bacterium]|nr:MAG: methyltransferase domain-containing protein [Deltaproteobacteria bacterium]
MLTLVPKAIETYCREHSTPISPILRELARETYARAQSPQMQVGHLEGLFLRFLVEILEARHVLEIGTFTGYSALAMAEGLPDDGRIVTCDIDPEATAIAKTFWERSGHGHKIELRLAPALETLETLTGPFDLVFIDADKENYVGYWEGVVPKVRKGGLIVADNVLWSGRILEPKEASDHAIVRFNERVSADDRVEQVMLTIRDGILLARKR